MADRIARPYGSFSGFQSYRPRGNDFAAGQSVLPVHGMRIAAIDVGTNTALLLIADVDCDGALRPVADQQRFIRLGQGVDANRIVSSAALERLRGVLLEYKGLAETHEVDQIRVAATSASRDVRDRARLVTWVREKTGLDYEIISGEQEAKWSFRGAMAAMPGFSGRCATIDIGGGSTELVVGEASGHIVERRSFDVGSVRLSERFFTRQPPPAADIARATAFVDDLLADSSHASAPLVGASDTQRLMVYLERGVSSWEELASEMPVLTSAAVRKWRERLLTMTFAEVLAMHPLLMDGRADIFPAAVLINDRLLRRYDIAQARVSPWGLRHGLILRALRGKAT